MQKTSTRLFALAAFIPAWLGVQAIDVTVESGQTLAGILADQTLSEITELKVATATGVELAESELTWIHTNLTGLKTLDMQEADVVRGKFPNFNNNATIEIFYMPRNTVSVGGVVGTQMKEIYIPNTLNVWAMSNRFTNNQNLTGIYKYNEGGNTVSIDGVIYDSDMKQLVVYPAGKTDADVVVPEGITQMPTGAMTNNKHIITLTLPSTYTAITTTCREFGGTNDSRTNNPNLKAIYVADGNENFASLSGMLLSLTTKEILTVPNAFEIPENLVVEGSLVDHISGTHFANQNVMKSVTFTEGFKRTDGGLFKNAQALEYAELPASMEVVSGELFHTCNNLGSVLIKATTPPSFNIRVQTVTKDGVTTTNYYVGTNPFYGLPSDAILGVPPGSVEAYRNSCWCRDYTPGTMPKAEAEASGAIYPARPASGGAPALLADEGTEMVQLTNNCNGFAAENIRPMYVFTGIENVAVAADALKADLVGSMLIFNQSGNYIIYSINGQAVTRGYAEADEPVDVGRLVAGCYIVAMEGQTVKIALK